MSSGHPYIFFSFHEMLFPLLLLLLLLLLFLDNHISRTTQATAMISGQIHSKFYQLRSFLLVDPRKSR